MCEFLKETYGDSSSTADTILRLQHIFKFDPALPAYTPEQSARMSEWRRQKAESTGQSLYTLAGGKRAYDKQKQMTARSNAQV